MTVTGLCESYFSGFHELYDYRNNTLSTNVAAAVKVASYFTGVIPLIVGAIYIAASLCGRVSSSFPDVFKTTPPKDYMIVQSEESKKVRPYTGDLTPQQKARIETKSDNSVLSITLNYNPAFNISIRRQDLFLSGAKVIVNAANTWLGGGGGIDGQIHAQGGTDYAGAHRQLQKLYNSNYVEGHATLIESGRLQEIYKIDHVIVVAGPSGSTTVEKENALYSCYYNSLLLAHEQNLTSIAFPSISTGIFGFPRDRAAAISLKAIWDFTSNYPETKLTTISIHFLETEKLENSLNVYQAAAKVR